MDKNTYEIISFAESLYNPAITVTASNTNSLNMSVLVTIQPPTPAMSLASIVDYQLIVSRSGFEETITVSDAMRYIYVVELLLMFMSFTFKGKPL